MTIEYRLSAEEVVRLQRMLWTHQRLRLGLLFGCLYGSTVCFAGGGVLLAMGGARWGLILTAIAIFCAVAVAIAHVGARPTVAKVRKQREVEPWRDATYRMPESSPVW